MKVVNLFGGPGSGKSTTKAGLFYLMKLSGFKVEEAPEWIKEKVYEGSPYPFHDQLYTLAKQSKKLKEMEGKVDWVVTDSPLLLSHIYGDEKTATFKKLIDEEFERFDNINVFIKRVKPYQEFGRNQTEDEARIKDSEIETLLREKGHDVVYVSGDELAPGAILSILRGMSESPKQNIHQCAK